METNEQLDPQLDQLPDVQGSIEADHRRLDLNVGQLIALGNSTAAAEHRTFTNEHGVKFTIIVDPTGGTRLERIPDTRPDPEVAGVASFEDIAGFCAYVNKFKGTGTAIYSGEIYTCYLDGHENAGTPGRADHKATLDVITTDRFLEWTVGESKKQTQKNLAEFFEDNADDLLGESASTDIAEYVLNFSKERVEAINSKAELANDNRDIGYSDKSNVNDFKFMIELPVYQGTDATFTIVGKIRHRVDDGKLQMWYELKRLDRVLKMADDDVAEQIATTTDITPYRGSFSAKV